MRPRSRQVGLLGYGALNLDLVLYFYPVSVPAFRTLAELFKRPILSLKAMIGVSFSGGFVPGLLLNSNQTL